MRLSMPWGPRRTGAGTSGWGWYRSRTTSPTRSEGTGKNDGVRAAVVGAVATAVASAVVGGFQLNWFRSDATSTTTTTTTATRQVASKTVVSSDQAISMVVPGDWGVAPTDWDVGIAGLVDPGAGFRAGKGSGLISNLAFDAPSQWIGTSTALPQRLGFGERSALELGGYLTTMARSVDWTRSQCVLVRESPVTKAGYVGSYRLWRDCAGFVGTRYWDLYAVSETGETLVLVQMTGGSETTEEQETVQLTQWSIRPEVLAAGPAKKVGKDAYPAPSWYVPPASRTGSFVIP